MLGAAMLVLNAVVRTCVYNDWDIASFEDRSLNVSRISYWERLSSFINFLSIHPI